MADASLRQRVGVLLNLDQTIAKVDSTLDRFDGILNDFTGTLERFTAALEGFTPVVEKVDELGDDLEQIVVRLDRVTERMDRLVGGLETIGAPLKLPDQVRKLGDADHAAASRKPPRLGRAPAPRNSASWRPSSVTGSSPYIHSRAIRCQFSVAELAEHGQRRAARAGGRSRARG